MKDPFVLAQQLKDLVVDRIDDPPAVRYVAPGLSVAYDGPQLTTNVTRIYPGQPGAETATFIPARPVPISCDIQTVIVRNVHVLQESGEPPKPEDLESDAMQGIGDMMTLRQILYDILHECKWIDNGVPVSLGAVTAIGPQGGVVGAAGTVSVVIS